MGACKLDDWTSVAADFPASAVLMGNGFSINIDEGFGYDQLFHHASLDAVSKSLFAAAKAGTNFEVTLRRLEVASAMAGPLAVATTGFTEAADTIRKGLIAAIRSRHPDKGQYRDKLWSTLRTELLQFRRIYTTNYDLLPYWALMHAGDESFGFTDMFWPDGYGVLRFDPDALTEGINGEDKTILYLHGSLLLSRDLFTGEISKIRSGSNHLLDSIATQWIKSRQAAHFVAEGSQYTKLKIIESSHYLDFCLRTLMDDIDPLVIVGQSLQAADVHIANALMKNRDRANPRIAVGVYPPHCSELELARLRELLGPGVVLFDIQSHPLTDPNLSSAA